MPVTDVQFILDCLRDEEEGDARLYAHLFRGRCIYDHTEKMWCEWRGNFWERDECKHSLLLASGPLASAYLDTSAQLSDEAAQAEKQLDPDVLKYPNADDPDCNAMNGSSPKPVNSSDAPKRSRNSSGCRPFSPTRKPT